MIQCPYCGSSKNLDFKIFHRHVHRCLECDLVFKNTKKDYNTVLETYRSEDYFNMYIYNQTESKRNTLYGHILDTIEKKSFGGRLLDVGTGCGLFLHAARERGWMVKGIEPSYESVKTATNRYDLEIFHGTLKEFLDKDLFDVVTFVNVLDHSAEPWNEIKHAYKLLKPGGLIYLRFPNGFLHTGLPRLAAHLGLSEKFQKYFIFHEFSFSLKFITRFLSNTGFSDVVVSNSTLSKGDSYILFPSSEAARYAKYFLYQTAKAIQTVTHGKLLVGSSLQVLAIK